MLVVERVFTWDIESFVDLCFDVVFVVTLVEQIRRSLSARLYGIDIYVLG